MPIVVIEGESFRQRCAACESERALSVGELEEHADVPPAVLRLPPCACGAVEHLIRAPANEPEHPHPGSFGHRHRVLVDALVDVVRSGEGAQSSHGGTLAQRVEEQIPSSALSTWFPEGLRIEGGSSTVSAGDDR